MKKVNIIRSHDENYAEKVENQPFSKHFYTGFPLVDIDAGSVSHKMLGFGASFTDSACFVIDRMPEAKKAALLDELFSPDGLALSVGRLNVGASDYATGVYSYDDTPDDAGMEHFSIDRDRAYIIPLLRRVKKMCPEMFFFASPWSPPGWMKTSGRMCGGYMRHKYLAAFADYYVAYLKAYRDAGVDISAVTMQNESDTDQNGKMPASQLHPDFESELLGSLLPERLKKAGLDGVKLWMYDHNYSGWARPLRMLADPDVRKNVEAVAFHPYDGTPDMIGNIRSIYPDVQFHMTEKGPNLRKDSPENTICWWARTIAGALNNGCASFCGWNLALDENGCPNVGPFDCAGLVEVESHTSAVTPSAQYRAFRHYSPYIERGADVIVCPGYDVLAREFDCVVCRNPSGTVVITVCNPGDRQKCVQFKLGGEYLNLLTPGGSLTTLTVGN